MREARAAGRACWRQAHGRVMWGLHQPAGTPAAACCCCRQVARLHLPGTLTQTLHSFHPPTHPPTPTPPTCVPLLDESLHPGRALLRPQPPQPPPHKAQWVCRRAAKHRILPRRPRALQARGHSLQAAAGGAHRAAAHRHRPAPHASPLLPAQGRGERGKTGRCECRGAQQGDVA